MKVSVAGAASGIMGVAAGGGGAIGIGGHRDELGSLGAVEEEEEELLVVHHGHGGVHRGSADSNSVEFNSRASSLTTTDSFCERGGAGAESEESLQQRLRFEDLLRRSREEDLTSIEETACLYRAAGYDKQGRAVIVFIGKWFRQSQVDLDKALLYLLRVVEPVADGEYVVVYFHTKTQRDNIPSYWWIKQIYSTLPYKYKKNLKAFMVVHPTMWTKMTCWWFSTFMAPAIKNKIHNVRALQDLSALVDHKELGMPMFITEQDMVFNGLRPFQP